MAIYSIAGRSTVVGTTARAIASVFATASVGFRLLEVHVFNTTTTATAVALARFTAATNVGTGLTEAEYDEVLPPPLCTGFAGHTGDGTTGQIICQASLGAAIGSGVMWTFREGIAVQIGTANGIGVIGVSGVTGQILDYTYVWYE
jgi:hypothetical protein